MIPSLFFYQLAILGLLWLCVMLHSAWPSQCAAAQGTPVKPIKPRRQRSKEPTPFAGLTHKPHCVLCEHEATPPKPPPPVPPAPVIVTKRRPRQVDTSMHFCPHPGCDYRGWLGRGNLRANGHPSGGPWRQLHCTGCDAYFLETHGTPLHGKCVPPEMLVWAVGALAEGLGIRAVARVFEPTFRSASCILVNIQRYNLSYGFPRSWSRCWCSSVRLSTRGHCPGRHRR